MKEQEIGIYVHIPFCKKKCFYCDFTSFCMKDEYIDNYIKALLAEISKNIKNTKNAIVTTIYIGGGTPSYINSKYIEKIVKTIKQNFKISNDCEITIEVNPGTADKEKIKHYYDIGINRLSIGLQSTDDSLLKILGRIHNYNEFLNTYKTARKIGFKNINVDLMLGLPNQNILDLKKSLNEVIDLNPEHISVYSLILEENTKLYDLINEGKLKLPDEEIERNMYWYVKNILELKGYLHYEISNFAKKGFESKHNMNCWEQKEYLGFGVAAHSYFDGKRYCNISNLENYIGNIENNEFEKNMIIQEKQNLDDKKKEYMLLGLRKIDGVSIDKFKNNFGENPIYLFRKEIDMLTNKGLIQIDGDNIKLTNKGLDFANIVWEEFV